MADRILTDNILDDNILADNILADEISVIKALADKIFSKKEALKS